MTESKLGRHERKARRKAAARLDLRLLFLYHALLALALHLDHGFLVEEDEDELQEDALAWRPEAYC